jgi:hypothetical protein
MCHSKNIAIVRQGTYNYFIFKLVSIISEFLGCWHFAELKNLTELKYVKSGLRTTILSDLLPRNRVLITISYKKIYNKIVWFIWEHLSKLCFYDIMSSNSINRSCNQCLSPLMLWVQIPLTQVRCTRYNIMWWKIVSDLWHISGLLWVFQFPPPIKLTIVKYCWKWH